MGKSRELLSLLLVLATFVVTHPMRNKKLEKQQNYFILSSNIQIKKYKSIKPIDIFYSIINWIMHKRKNKKIRYFESYGYETEKYRPFYIKKITIPAENQPIYFFFYK